MATERSVIVVAVHPVRDFGEWKDVVATVESPDGVVRSRIFQSSDDPNEVLVLIEMETLDHAKAVIPSFALRELLDRAGVEIYPAVFVGTEVEELRRDGSSGAV
jgi:hypothetical protein